MVKIKSSSKRLAIIALIPLLLVTLAGYTFYKSTRGKDSSSPITVKKTANSTNSTGINMEPATPNDAKRAEENKQRIIDREKNLSQQSTAKKTVIPTITYASQYKDDVEIDGFVDGVFEDGGKCTATFKKDGSSFAKSSPGVKNVSSVSCPAIVAEVGEFSSKGTWTITLSYESSTASGTSTPKNIEVK